MPWIDQLRKLRLFKLLYLLAWVGMALAFIISGIRKLPGVQFTILPETNPVGAFFHAMHETGFYWNFIGVFQIIIGILIFVPRLRVLCILLMMPVTVNIWLVSLALRMGGTPVITTAMLLGNVFMMLWHYERFLPIVRKSVV